MCLESVGKARGNACPRDSILDQKPWPEVRPGVFAQGFWSTALPQLLGQPGNDAAAPQNHRCTPGRDPHPSIVHRDAASSSSKDEVNVETSLFPYGNGDVLNERSCQDFSPWQFGVLPFLPVFFLLPQMSLWPVWCSDPFPAHGEQVNERHLCTRSCCRDRAGGLLAAENSKVCSFLALIPCHRCSEGSGRDRSCGDTVAAPLLSLGASSTDCLCPRGCSPAWDTGFMKGCGVFACGTLHPPSRAFRAGAQQCWARAGAPQAAKPFPSTGSPGGRGKAAGPHLLSCWGSLGSPPSHQRRRKSIRQGWALGWVREPALG